MADPTVPNPMVPPGPAAAHGPAGPLGPAGPVSPQPGQPGFYAPPGPSGSPQPPASQTRHGFSPRSPIVTGIAGLVVGAFAAGVPWALSGSSSSSPFGAAKGALTAPAAIAGFKPLEHNPKADAATVKRMAESDPISAKNLSAAYGGAAAVVQQYTDTGLENFVELEAVRAQSPTPFQPYEDAHALGMDKPVQEIDTFGQVTCLVVNVTVPLGQQEQPNSANVVTCERTSAHLTVRLRFGGGGGLAHTPQQAAALVDTAWNSLS